MNVDQISKKLSGIKPGKNLSVFLVCLLLAFLFWMLNAFTKQYSTVIEIPIEYLNIPKDKILSKSLPVKTSVEVTGTGFRLLTVSVFDSPEPILIDFNVGNKQIGFKKLVSSFGPDQLRSQVLNNFPSDLSLSSLSIDSLKVIVEDKSKKSLKVGVNLAMDIEYPFFINGQIIIEPKTITIMGGNSAIQSMDSIYTDLLDLGNLQSSFKQLIKLNIPKELESNIDEVTIEIPVDEYTEGKIEIPIEIENLGEMKQLIVLPSSITVTYLVGLSQYEMVKADDFKFIVDASQIEEGKTTLLVTQKRTPKYVQVQEFSPHKVEFILK